MPLLRNVVLPRSAFPFPVPAPLLGGCGPNAVESLHRQMTPLEEDGGR